MEDPEATESEEEICFLPDAEGGSPVVAADAVVVSEASHGKSDGGAEPSKPRKSRKNAGLSNTSVFSFPGIQSPGCYLRVSGTLMYLPSEQSDAPPRKTKGQERKRKLKGAEEEAGVSHESEFP